MLASLSGCTKLSDYIPFPISDYIPFPTFQNEPDVYPEIADEYFEDQDITAPPDVVYNTTAEENGLDGTIYKVTGTVTAIKTRGERLIYLDTDQGPVVVINAVDGLLAQIHGRVYQEKCEAYFTQPKVGNYVCIYSEYLGYSDVLDCPCFIYGGSEYITDAFAASTIGMP